MKKLIVLAFAAMLTVACSPEEEITPNEGSNLEVVLENYKGIFTSSDGQYRGTLDITLSEDNRYATADLTLSTGEVISILTDQVSNVGNVKEITFTTDELSFTMTTGVEEEILEIDTVSFRGTESAILASRNTERAPVTPITGTFNCPGCPAPLNNSTTQTFNFMFTSAPNGNSAISTQTTLNTTTYNGIGVQSSCVDGGNTQTTCTILSGDGVTTGVAFNAGGGNVGWTGTHTFDNGPTSSNDCSGVSGNWGWNSPILGNIGDTFISDGACPPPVTTVLFEDFEDATVGYVLRDEFPTSPDFGQVLAEDISEAMTEEDYLGRLALSNLDPLDGLDFSGFQGTHFFGANDIDGISSIDNLTDFVSMTWSDINISGLSNITVSSLIAEGDADDNLEDWDGPGSGLNECVVRLEYSFDNTTWTPVFSIIGSGPNGDSAPILDANNDGTGDGAIITEVFQEISGSFSTGGNATVSIRFFIEHLSGTDEDIAFDNFTISGN